MPSLQVGTADSALGRDQVSSPQSDFHPEACKSGRRLPVRRDAEAQEVVFPPAGDRDLFSILEVDPLSTMEFPLSSGPSRPECPSTDVAEAQSVCLFSL